MSLKNLPGHFDSDVLQLLDFELVLDQMVPIDRDALYGAFAAQRYATANALKMQKLQVVCVGAT
jgi:hypothetical protein